MQTNKNEDVNCNLEMQRLVNDNKRLTDTILSLKENHAKELERQAEIFKRLLEEKKIQ